MSIGTMKYSEVTLGLVEAVFNKLGGVEGVQSFLRNELVVSKSSRSWSERDGVIYLTVTSDGTSGAEWIAHFERKGYNLNRWSKDLLLSEDFRPTSGVVYEVAILKGMIFEDRDRVTKKIRAQAESRQFSTPNAEVACLIRDLFSDEELEAMGLMWVVTMHEPIKDSGGDPRLLCVSRGGEGRWLCAFYDVPDGRWIRDFGFAFVVSQVSTQN